MCFQAEREGSWLAVCPVGAEERPRKGSGDRSWWVCYGRKSNKPTLERSQVGIRESESERRLKSISACSGDKQDGDVLAALLSVLFSRQMSRRRS